ncbi:hypothetical protein [Pseudomonas aeruginosa]|uniref:hypothetical protein n=2 Tax=Pseudomonas aeruginosa TaxID=287 RepID=UPI000AA422F8|nr:hypothetical protein [Pseudomonas aeruginosa]EKU9563379.1 hypothetical protein [Pseudomonas aeruginosa]EKX2040410.1 hypothetical protein [Pseudomonas aeruginosa]MBG5587598.1 hypothetical protein [Pseudomonas aeruginosa]MBH4518061.1 hypothetical protein [Pseudomonas aeruginosa]MBH8645820.1 hypothetical protein [Pseudomonas aeruginosa]
MQMNKFNYFEVALNTDTTVLLPQAARGIIGDTASYWASFYCAILKTVRYQKNLPFNWGYSSSLQEYKGALRESGFFGKMESTVLNHAFEYVMVDFLKTKTGVSYFKELCASILSEYDIKGFNITKMNIFKVGNDSEFHFARKNYDKTRVLMLLPRGIKAYPTTKTPGLSLNETLKNSDLFILISNDEETIGFVGEVEGNHGEDLFLSSYYKDKPMKDKYCTFGIGVSDKNKHGGNSIKGEVSLNRSEAVERWILHFSKSNYFAKDYRSAVRGIKALVDGHFGYLEDIEDPGHQKILDMIREGWGKNVLELIAALELFVDYISPAKNYYYQEVVGEKILYRPSPLVMPDQFPLYSIGEEETSPHQSAEGVIQMF